MSDIRILFTGVGRRVELIKAFRQAALVLNKSIKLYGADMSVNAPALVYCDYSRKVCAMRDANYIPELLRLCQEDRIDLLIPTIDTDLLVLSKNAEQFESIGCKVLVSKPEMIKICRDKNLTFSFFLNCGVKAPVSVNNWTNYSGGYPAFIKPKDGSSSINAFKAESEKELALYASQINEYIVQPFVEGREYTIDVFCDFDGNPISIVPRERLAVRSGEVLKTRICMDEEMIKEAGRIVSKFKPCGPITIQLIKDKHTQENFYIEINPRFGGGAPLSMKAGARSTEALLKMISGESFDSYDKISDNAVYSRFDESICCFLGTDHEKIRGVIFDLDDTLYSEKEYVKSGYRAVSNYLGNEAYTDRLWDFFEKSLSPIDELLHELSRDDEKKECLNVYRTNKPNIHLYAGVADMLFELRKLGVKIGVITDGRPVGQKNKIEALGLSNMVDDIIITDELGGEQFRKPCDIAFRIMQTRWKIPYEQIIYVADNAAKDFHAPRQLGMKSMWVKNIDSLYFSQEGSSDYEVMSLDAARMILKSII